MADEGLEPIGEGEDAEEGFSAFSDLVLIRGEDMFFCWLNMKQKWLKDLTKRLDERCDALKDDDEMMSF